MEITKRFVEFDGEENEIDFLKKCLDQWILTSQAFLSDNLKVCEIATVFHEISHRIDELEEIKEGEDIE